MLAFGPARVGRQDILDVVFEKLMTVIEGPGIEERCGVGSPVCTDPLVLKGKGTVRGMLPCKPIPEVS